MSHTYLVTLCCRSGVEGIEQKRQHDRAHSVAFSVPLSPREL